jgi:hypothetical protein
MDDQLHLTDEQFTGILLGEASAAVLAHLGACSQCAAEATRVESAVGNFKHQSQLWAERRAATRPPIAGSRQHETLWAGRRTAWTTAALGLVLAACAGLGIHKDRRLIAASSENAQLRPSAQLSSATLKADNDLLSAIDGELRADESTSLSSYNLSATSHTDTTKTARRTISE